ncbi:3'-5' exonuclease [Mycobacterium sp. M1]|uniref:3'-5' exonuclease n=1 Tax=Mycolicibacter acidiphilus TaxID=2835306 RepID=A0ABS5RKQ6_9MYCO|nr:3'-5' exonuclease [Mycolicibacter acidiphilus]MBS9534888.1 3'-5' exonuclease [Mycolicibacter acidiphilus]
MAFAVIDFETTGFVPERTDRVIEVGVVLTDDDGRVECEWTTLVNPGRSVGASHVHRIAAADVVDAPEFATISGQLIELLRGRTVVAHNASFDMRFLHSELQRARYTVPERPAAVCSMKWSRRVVGASKLADCCDVLGIDLDDAHSALCDARATAQVLAHLVDSCRGQQDWVGEVQRAAGYRWPRPALAASAVTLAPRVPDRRAPR